MALTARFTAITLNGLGVIVAMITPILLGASGSAAGAWRVHIR